MSETHVTGIGQRETVEIGGRRYTLRPITFGEAAAMAEAEACTLSGGPALFAETVREALRRKLGDKAEPYIAAVDAHEEADTEATAIAVTRPHPEEPAEAKTAWSADMRRAHTEVLRAHRRRVVAEAKVADDPEVVKARFALERAAWERMVRLVRTCLTGWEGEGLPPWPEGGVTEDMLRELPERDVRTLAEKAEKLRRPGVIEGKA